MRTNKELCFSGSDYNQDRFYVEKQKVKLHFPSFEFYAQNGKISSVKGWLSTNYDDSFKVSIMLPENYPYDLPEVHITNTTLKSGCPHKFSDDRICIMKTHQWSETYSIAFLISKAAIWLNKYGYWQRNGSWPGQEQPH